jgi:MFS family permease
MNQALAEDARRVPTPSGEGALVLLLVLTSILSMLNSGSFPALTPELKVTWHLSNTEAGWISGIFYGGYICAVPVFVSLTDHMDSRRIYLSALVVTGVAALSFALLADGFWSAAIARAVAGAGLAGTYMPGLRLLTDRTSVRRQPRWIALYTASYGLGSSVSYVATLEMAARIGWRGALLVAAAAALLSFALILFVPRHDHPAFSGRFHLPDLRPVARNRQAMRYIALYGFHNWELFAFQSWVVAYLTWCSTHGATGPGWLAWVSWITAGSLIAGMGGSIAGAELATRFGRRRTIAIVMCAALALAPLAGSGGYLPAWTIVVACLAFGTLTMTDSAAITTGAMFAAVDGQRGITLAAHSIVGFFGGLVGPLAIGVVLDLAAPWGEAVGWLAAFVVMAAGSVAGLALIAATSGSVGNSRS